ncbi:caspase family protein [Nonomuraea pusilla]|uniref:Histidine kinase-, DNA gyrase B-, and HSP90-like ATPase n=1 Tax=Nonomuraea pusilla TaxID=46177 RepID=A0A1H8A0J8_9ACTN|nr:caspase family protein [Nonomuraea pusilla]SEM64265.1 Histidine kinase-, DNA gyrase B-, and HSP90-like ATPase [Nonomuraea pusilla]
MTERHALLIGVPRCDDSAFSDIGDIVRMDVRAMRQALDQSGYANVEVFGVEGLEEPTSNRIRNRIKRACETVPDGGVLLLYFSGHGITVNGTDYLVPSDADRDFGAAAPAVEDLVPVIPQLQNCRAKLVVFFVDACRDDPAQPHATGVHGGMLPFLHGGDFIVVTGCRAGQRCLYGESGSYFSQALAQTLDRRNPARTLQQVLDDVQRQMARKSGMGHDNNRQEPEAHFAGTTLPAADVMVCDGDELTVAWRRAVESTRLWNRAHTDLRDVSAVRDAVKDIVDKCARRCGEARTELMKCAGINDPWTDQNYPVRVLDRVPLLLAESVELSLAEVAMLVSAPFLRERVIAEGVRQAARIAPTAFERTYISGPRSDLEVTHEMHQHLVQRAEGLTARGENEARDALAMWLVHQWLAAGSSLWRGPDAKRAYHEAASLLDGLCSATTSGELVKLVEAIVRTVGADPVDHQVQEQLGKVYVGDRWRGLSVVAWLAGLLAADARRMPSVIADHLGTRLELPVATVKLAAERLDWRRSEDRLDLHFICDHPALHLAMQDLADRATKALETARVCLPMAQEVVKALPERVTAEGLRPEQRGEEPAYATPVTTFRLAEEKVRELLMGRQLYDDPAMAIREVYQNALDACRYRRTRIDFLRSKKVPSGAWQGRIMFHQGVDEGRPYIECSDNGVGMDPETLLHVFASAGERFVYRQDYRAEQADWQSVVPPLRMVSNSQFGVGVFSYFMLADELTVVTRPVGRNGIVSQQAYHVHIASSGSLLQITPSASGMPEGGTMVRLYLTGDEDISVLRTLRQLLWVAEYAVEAAEDGVGAETWEPGELRYQDETVKSLRYGHDLWWVSGEGGLMADGIRTNEEIFGLVVNLRDMRRPQFSVSRKELSKWDKKWVETEIERSLPILMSWPGLTLTWLWEVTESAPHVAQRIFDHIVRTGGQLPVGGALAGGAVARSPALGCLPGDERLLDPLRSGMVHARWFAAWRVGVWVRHTGTRPTGTRIKAPTEDPTGFPVVGPIDADLLTRLDVFRSDVPPGIRELVEALADEDEDVATRIKRLRRYAITGLNITAARDVPPVKHIFDDKKRPLLWALAAWSPLGEPPQQYIAHLLARASNEMDQPLGQVLIRAAALAPENWAPPELELGPLADYTCTAADTLLTWRPTWQESEGDMALSPALLVEIAAGTGRTVDQALLMCDRLRPLGVEVAGRGRYPEQLTLLEVEALRLVEYVGLKLDPLHLVVIAARGGTTVHEAHARLARLAETGLLSLPDLAGLPDIAPGEAELELIEGDLRHAGRYGRLVLCESASTITELLWVLCGRGNREARLVAAARSLVPFVRAEAITSVQLFRVAWLLYCSVAETREHVLSVFPGIRLPPVKCEESMLIPTDELGYALAGDRWPRRLESVWHLAPGEIVWGALDAGQTLGEFLKALVPYQGLGAPVPVLDEAAMDSMNHYYPDVYDAYLLVTTSDDLTEAPTLRRVTALDLVRIAGRYGWPVSKADERLRRLEPLGLTLEYPAGACPDVLVQWQDLLALTVHLDGHAPAIGVTVTRLHLAQAAEQLEESPAQIRDRLRPYTALFRIALPEEEFLA